MRTLMGFVGSCQKRVGWGWDQKNAADLTWRDAELRKAWCLCS
jgi:hypothetical protein